MTYLVAIKCRGSVILAADTAITKRSSFGPLKPADAQQTTFGESTISETKRCVEEGMNKIFHLGNSAAVVCGGIDAAGAVIDQLRFALMGRSDARDALEVCVQNCRGSTNGTPAIIAISFPSENGARLFTIDTKNWNLKEYEHDGILQLGSMPEKFKILTKAAMDKYVDKIGEQTDRLLSVTLGILQSYGTYAALLGEHVGGVFCGLRVDSSDVTWQSDILYAVHAAREIPVGFVHCAVRDNVLVVNSSIIGECRYFVGRINCPDFPAWKQKWWERAYQLVGEAEFGFVTFLNKQHRITVIVEMACNEKSKDVQFNPTGGKRSGEPLNLNMTTSGDLVSCVTQPFTEDESFWKIAWRPYRVFDQSKHG